VLNRLAEHFPQRTLESIETEELTDFVVALMHKKGMPTNTAYAGANPWSLHSRTPISTIGLGRADQLEDSRSHRSFLVSFSRKKAF
jgi:hypothetical protein